MKTKNKVIDDSMAKFEILQCQGYVVSIKLDAEALEDKIFAGDTKNAAVLNIWKDRLNNKNKEIESLTNKIRELEKVIAN
jgi:hypothetical protein